MLPGGVGPERVHGGAGRGGYSQCGLGGGGGGGGGGAGRGLAKSGALRARQLGGGVGGGAGASGIAAVRWRVAINLSFGRRARG